MNARSRRLTMLAATTAIALATIGTAYAQATTPAPVVAPAPAPAVTSAPAPAPAVAADGKPTVAIAMFEGMDGNHDGVVATAEHEDAAGKMFDMMDTDANSNVTVAEMDAAHQKITGQAMPGAINSAQKIRAIDSNEDGILSRTEHDAGSAAMFQKMDGNSDGKLTQQEFDAGHAGL